MSAWTQTTSSSFFPWSRPIHLVAASPRFVVVSRNVPSFRTRTSVLTHRPRT